MNDTKKNNDSVEQNSEDTEEVVEVDQMVDPEIKRLQNEVEESKSKYVRVLADYQNLEKRVQEQRRELLVNASRDIILKILPILDTLQLAKKHSEDGALSASIQQFLAILQSEGVTAIKAQGKEFDPMLMECLTTVAGKENIVIEELRTGYMLNDKVLRPAQVSVGDGKEK
ncbi:nucleotide exchange factor GrpE [soil metagenome]